MKHYVNPEMSVITLVNEDILTVSGQEKGNATPVGYEELFPQP